MPSFSRQRKAFHDCAVLFTHDFSGSDYFWILRLWPDKEGLVRRVRRDGLRSAPPLRMRRD